MPLSNEASAILYVPFSTEYTVSSQEAMCLNTDIFFKECYVRPQLEQNMNRLNSMPQTEITDPEYPLKTEDLIRTYSQQIEKRQSFLNWFGNNGEGIYLIRGDAGAGKTTYVNFLKWQYNSIQWNILDMKQASEKINIFGQRVKFSKFHLLHQKIISCIIDQIISTLFIKYSDGEKVMQVNPKETLEQISALLKVYTEKILPSMPEDEYDLLYRSLDAITKPETETPTESEATNYCRNCAQVLADYFMKYCVMADDISDALECAIIHYMILLQCFRGVSRQKTIIVFDNIERFIGVHEIFSNELIKFIRNLRRIVDSNKKAFFDSRTNRNRFAENFQFIVAMRNTSARGFTPQQNSDFFEGSIDLGEWFSVGEIILRKLEWLKKNGVEIKNGDRLQYILNDFGIATDGIVRGLRPKLNLIFNCNKRLAVEFLVEILNSVVTQGKLDAADDLRLRKLQNSDSGSLGTFAYRSIIWRLLMDKLNQGGMFRYILSKKNALADSALDLTHIRNILTVLSNYSLTAENPYMPIEDLISTLYHLTDNPSVWFDDQTWEVERRKTAQLLFHMNYYNRRDNHWFQFVDVQCNDASYDGVHLENWEDILKMLETKNKHRRKIAVRITDAGQAYVGYIAHTFEFISCMEDCTTPLLCALPTESELKEKPIAALDCVQIIESISTRIDHYMEGDDLSIKFERHDHAHEYPYSLRLIHAHIGYLDNFCECIKCAIVSNDEDIKRKKDALLARIKEVINLYRNKGSSLEQMLKKS